MICFQCQHAPGHLVGLLQIVVTPSIDISIRQVASIEFKNAVGRHWSNDTRNGILLSGFVFVYASTEDDAQIICFFFISYSCANIPE